MPTLSIFAIRAAIAESAQGVTKPLSEPMVGAGALALVARRGKAHWYFRYSPSKGSNVRNWPLGAYDEAGKGGGIGLTAARTKAAELSQLASRPESRDLHRFFAEKDRATLQARAAEEHAATSAAEALRRKTTFTLRRLLSVYCDYLEKTGRVSAPKVRSDLERHVFVSPAAELAAADVSKSDLTPIIRALSEQGKIRTAGQVRSYIRAAYSLALGADTDAQAPALLLSFGITENPADLIKAIPVGKRERALTDRELQAFLVRLDADGSLTADAVRLSLLTGGQRPQQVLRLRLQGHDELRGEVTLMDGKGRRAKPRKHLLPMGPQAKALVARLAERAKSLPKNENGFLFTSDGSCEMVVSTPSHWVTEVSKQMVASKEVAAPFMMKDVRRTATTHMARLGISSDVRAQLQSNDLGGLQSSVYDQHEYFAEKQKALAQWERYLSKIRSGKTPLGR